MLCLCTGADDVFMSILSKTPVILPKPSCKSETFLSTRSRVFPWMDELNILSKDNWSSEPGAGAQGAPEGPLLGGPAALTVFAAASSRSRRCVAWIVSEELDEAPCDSCCKIALFTSAPACGVASDPNTSFLSELTVFPRCSICPKKASILEFRSIVGGGSP